MEDFKAVVKIAGSYHQSLISFYNLMAYLKASKNAESNSLFVKYSQWSFNWLFK